MTTISDVTTPPSSGFNHIDAVLDSGPGWNWLLPARNTLYYTFTLPTRIGSEADMLTGEETAFNAAQRSAAQVVLAKLTQITGINFVATADDSAADLHFACADITARTTSGYCSWSWRDSYSGETITHYSADAYIFLDNVEYQGQTNSPTVANGGIELLLHELGHAMGLKHPFEGDVQLPAAENSTLYTRMSYTHLGGPYGDYGPDDIAALMWLYGGDGLRGALGQGSPGVYLVGTFGADRLHGGQGADRIDGGDGIDTVVFELAQASYRVASAGGATTIQSLASGASDTLMHVERVAFADRGLAFDLSGHAGTTAKFIAAVFGPEAVHNESYVGIGLDLLDGGMSEAALMQLALEARLGPGFSVADEVNVLYRNLVGQAPSPGDLQYWTNTVTSGQFSTVSLGLLAADHDLNLQHVDLVGLAQTGLGFI